MDKIKFPDGREVDLHDFLAFMYGLSRSDVEVLHLLLESNSKMSIEDMTDKLKVTKAAVSKSLNNLLNKGLIERNKEAESEKRKGRPSYVYWVDKDKLVTRLLDDLEILINNVKEGLKAHVKS